MSVLGLNNIVEQEVNRRLNQLSENSRIKLNIINGKLRNPTILPPEKTNILLPLKNMVLSGMQIMNSSYFRNGLTRQVELECTNKLRFATLLHVAKRELTPLLPSPSPSPSLSLSSSSSAHSTPSPISIAATIAVQIPPASQPIVTPPTNLNALPSHPSSDNAPFDSIQKRKAPKRSREKEIDPSQILSTRRERKTPNLDIDSGPQLQKKQKLTPLIDRIKAIAGPSHYAIGDLVLVQDVLSDKLKRCYFARVEAVGEGTITVKWDKFTTDAPVEIPLEGTPIFSVPDRAGMENLLRPYLLWDQNEKDEFIKAYNLNGKWAPAAG